MSSWTAPTACSARVQVTARRWATASFVPAMAKAAKAFGATGYFFEVHPDPDHGKSDAANMLELNKLEGLIAEPIGVSAISFQLKIHKS